MTDDITQTTGICKECGKVLTKEDVENMEHNRRSYCISCNKEYNKISERTRKAKMVNKVWCRDNLEIMKSIPDDYVDLIYLDPPYFTQTNWKNGDIGFSDNWKSMNEYLKFMELRFIEMHRILKPTGSIYLHVDHHAVFELKVIMDDIFGKKNFINDIVWTYSGRETAQPRFPHKHDTILLYSKSKEYTFNTLYKPYRKEYIETFFKNDDDDGKGKYQTQPDGKGGRYKQYLNDMEGQVINDVWDDIKPLNNFGRQQNLKYPTQKPIELLKRIIETSSNKDDIVFDPFCGSGTTLEAAIILERKYIGIDEKKRATKISKDRIPKFVQKTISDIGSD